MKKLVSMLLAATMAFSMVACGGSDASSTPASSTADASSTASQSDGSWPSKPITLLCGYSAGGSSDLGCRYLAEALKNDLGVPVIVENVPGSGSWLA